MFDMISEHPKGWLLLLYIIPWFGTVGLELWFEAHRACAYTLVFGALGYACWFRYWVGSWDWPKPERS